MLKKLLIISITAICCVSCNKMADRMTEEQQKAIITAQESAIKSIDEAKNSAINTATKDINTKIAEALQSATDDISKAMAAAKEEIGDQVTKEVNQNIEDLKAENKTILIFGFIGMAVGAIAIIIALISRIKLKRCFEEIDDIKKNSKLFEQRLGHLKEEIKYSKPQTISSKITSSIDIQKEVDLYFKSQSFKTKLLEVVQSIKSEPSIIEDSKPTESTNSVQIEMYARDSRTDELTDITPNYIAGKTLYRLSLSMPDANEANIDLCLDKEDAKRRIIEMGVAMLEPICAVTRNTTTPTDIKTIKGKAVKVGVGKWQVTDKIDVELN